MSTLSLTIADKRKALQRYDDDRERDRYSGRVIQEAVSTFQAHHVFQHNSSELVGAVPLYVNLIASCYTLSTSPSIDARLSRPASGEFRYTKFPYLRMCIISCGDGGARVFQQLSTHMDRLALSMSPFRPMFDAMLQTVAAGPREAPMLAKALRAMGRTAKDCSDQTAELDLSLSEWLGSVAEVHQSCTAKEINKEGQRIANITQLAVKQVQIATNKASGGATKNAVSELNMTLRAVQKSYREASDQFPSGWEAVAQHYIAGLMQTINNAFNISVPALVAGLDPTTQADEVFNLYGEADVAAQGDISLQPRSLPPDYNDPAYMAVTRVTIIANVLLSILTAAGGNKIDWESAKPKSGQEQGGASFCVHMLEFEMKSFKSSGKPPSVKFDAALKSIVQVARDLGVAVEAERASSTIPGADTVAGWQRNVQDAINTFAVLQATVDGFASPAIPPFDPQPIIESSKLPDALVEAVFDTAAQREAITQKALTTAIENCEKGFAIKANIAERELAIAGEVVQLQGRSAGQAEIKTVLTKLLGAIVQLKTQLRVFETYYSAISEVFSFVENIKLDGSMDDVKPSAEFQPAQLKQHITISACVTARAYFTLFADIARMWQIANQKAYRAGWEVLRDLSQAAQMGEPGRPNPMFDQRLRNLAQWTASSGDDLKRTLDEKRNDTLTPMRERADKNNKYSETLKLPDQQRQAIDVGKAIVTGAVNSGMDNYKPLITLESFKETTAVWTSSI